MRILTLCSIVAGLFAQAYAAEVELARGGRVSGWVTVRSGWRNQPVATVASEARRWQFDLVDVRRITVSEEDHVLATRMRDLRERPAENSRSVALVYPGFEFQILKEEGAWLQVKGFSEGDVGYIPKEATSREVRFTTTTPQPAERPADATPPADASPEAPADSPKSASPEKPSATP
ncbi:hypothetical protein HS125_07580 [bacterium]|nr:hypothetical protein [bacterium]